ncbi:WXG100 family type VII secretion target [Mycobacteroides franklinii]|uniref:WXG100 family type VII secretion target n=1 Tax=Mycobacteroides franklinii TaxID=948102 RepID=UPI0010D366F9|nr:ESAT-6-like protein EsxH [Mycobacteroides franklinii]TDZ65814.1 ESAT-6-like protein EsxH [Mycobacteroides franklinii]
MSLLDAHIPALVAAEGTFGAKTALMRSTISQAEQAAMSAQAFHVGESSVAFQAAHARFVEVAAKVNALLAGEMNTYSGVLTALGADLAAQQASLQAAWHGDTSMSQAAWQAQWNTAMEELIRAYRAMGTTHETNTLSMNARDMAEGAKWGA